MELPDFKKFSKIEWLDSVTMTITQKMHGTNAQILIQKNSDGELEMHCGSKTRWLTPVSDNYGFCQWANENKEELINFLGEGRHYGEWCGPGINSGEGLEEKTLFLFEFWKHKDKPSFPKNVRCVPVLHRGAFSPDFIKLNMLKLKYDGSYAVSGFYNVEGAVIQIGETRYKQVFKPEETQWVPKKKPKEFKQKDTTDYSHLFQPIRLQKVLSSDSTLVEEFPKSLPLIVKIYLSDLLEEKQCDIVTKELTTQTYQFVKQYIQEQ
jgi:hypothetical protein